MFDIHFDGLMDLGYTIEELPQRTDTVGLICYMQPMKCTVGITWLVQRHLHLSK